MINIAAPSDPTSTTFSEHLITINDYGPCACGSMSRPYVTTVVSRVCSHAPPPSPEGAADTHRGQGRAGVVGNTSSGRGSLSLVLKPLWCVVCGQLDGRRVHPIGLRYMAHARAQIHKHSVQDIHPTRKARRAECSAAVDEACPPCSVFSLARGGWCGERDVLSSGGMLVARIARPLTPTAPPNRLCRRPPCERRG